MSVHLSTSRDGLTHSTSPFRNNVRWLQNHPRLDRITTTCCSAFKSTALNSWEFYYAQSQIKRLFLLAALALGLASGITLLVFHNKVFEILLTFANAWKGLQTGPLIMFALVCVISFPPLIGYSALASLCGMMYGYWGWPLLTLATLVGSLISFLTCRYGFQDYAHRLARSNAKFAALTRTMETDGYQLLWMIRLCPLPYSLSNGALASIPSVTALQFVLSTLITSPKLLIHIFIGDRIARLGTELDATSRIINLISVVLALIVGSLTAYTIYVRTIERAESMNGVVYSDLELGADADLDDDDDDERGRYADYNDDDEFDVDVDNDSAQETEQATSGHD